MKNKKALIIIISIITFIIIAALTTVLVISIYKSKKQKEEYSASITNQYKTTLISVADQYNDETKEYCFNNFLEIIYRGNNTYGLTFKDSTGCLWEVVVDHIEYCYFLGNGYSYVGTYHNFVQAYFHIPDKNIVSVKAIGKQ